MINVTCYYRKEEPESENVLGLLREIGSQVEFNLVLVDVDQDPALKAHFSGAIPMVRIGPYTLKESITRQNIEVALAAAKDRAVGLENAGDSAYQERLARGRTFSWGDRLGYFLSAHYLFLFNVILAFFVGGAFLAPVFMKVGFDLGGRALYTIYSPFCHQMAFRSFFLFGEQPYYPRQLAGVEGILTYEDVANLNPGATERTDAFINNARSFIGNETLGYKMAICERDIALYGALLLFGLVYAAAGRRLRQVPWYVWLILGFTPIAIDGFSQLPGLFPGMPAFFPDRESTPFLRLLTGGLFGFLTAWYLVPLIEESMRETRALFAGKNIAVKQIKGGKRE